MITFIHIVHPVALNSFFATGGTAVVAWHYNLCSFPQFCYIPSRIVSIFVAVSWHLLPYPQDFCNICFHVFLRCHRHSHPHAFASLEGLILEVFENRRFQSSLGLELLSHGQLTILGTRKLSLQAAVKLLEVLCCLQVNFSISGFHAWSLNL